MPTFPTTDQFIQLNFRGLSLQFFRVFFDPTPPRRSDEVIEVGRSTYGTFYVMRRINEDYYKWEFSTLISHENKEILDAMYWEHSYLIRTKSSDPNPRILLTDCTQQFTERYPRTRAKAPTPFDGESVINGSISFVTYFSKFYVWFESQPEYTKQDEKLKVTLKLKEENLKVPTFLDG